jgi:all-trans-8'-apo-beta-carotenal 15,15'-oxygenase
MADHEWMWSSCSGDVDEREAPVVAGVLPDGLTGTFVRNGSGLVQIGPDRLHLLDGHALVAAMTLHGGHASFQAAQVRTPIREQETTAGRQLMRRVFTNRPGGWSNFFEVHLADTPNHDVYGWGGRVLATSDQCHWRLHPQNLSTLGPNVDHGCVDRGDVVAQMPKIDPEAGRLVLYTIKRSFRGDEILFHEVDPSWKRVTTRKTSLRRPFALLHEHAFTPSFHVAVLPPAELATWEGLSGRKTVWKAFRDARPAGEILLLPRSGGEARWIPLPDHHRCIFHVPNAFERDGNVVIWVCSYEGPVSFDAGMPPERRDGDLVPTPEPRVHEIVVDPDARKVLSERRMDGAQAEGARVNPAFYGKPSRFLFHSSPGRPGDEPDRFAFPWFHAITRTDTSTGEAASYDFGPRCYVSQPAFAQGPGGGESDGWLLSWVYDAAEDRTDVVVLEAGDLAKGPVARISTGTALPPASHTRFTSERLGAVE